MPPIAMPNGLTRFALPTADGSKEFALDLVEASQAFNALSRQCADEKLTNFEYLDKFAQWVRERVGVTLNKHQTLWLVRTIDEELARGKPVAEALPS